MWTRKELKIKSKTVLKRSYWKALVVSLLLSMVTGKGGNVYYSINNSINSSSSFSEGGLRSMLDPKLLTTIISVGIVVAIIVAIAAIAFSVFLGYPLIVGGSRFFVSLTVQDTGINNLGYAFKSGRYINIVKTMFYKSVLIFLWSLLFIIPGIIKAYAYSMVPYILADNPHIDYKRAVDLSKQMTKGEKFNIWVLDLSFIGWYLLGVLACGVGVVFVAPYVNTTKAELYVTLRRKALQNQLFSYEELTNNNQI